MTALDASASSLEGVKRALSSAQMAPSGQEALSAN